MTIEEVETGTRASALVVVSMTVLFLVGLMARLHTLHGEDRLAPQWERAVVAIELAVPLLPAFVLARAALRRKLTLRGALLLVALVVLGVGAGGSLATVLKRNWIFEPVFLRTQAAAHEQFHLYDSSFLTCRVTVYAGPPGALFVQEVAERPVACENKQLVRAVRRADGRVELEDP